MPNVKILVVEEERTTAADLVNRLRALGYNSSDTASSGEEALEKASKTRPDLVLMDIRMKGGTDSFTTGREIQDCFDVPVIYFAECIDDNAPLRTKATEPLPFLLRPFMERELRMGIEAALYKHKMGILRRFISTGG